MHIPDISYPHNTNQEASHSDLEIALEAYTSSMRQQALLLSMLTQALEQREREAKESIDAAQKQLLLIQNVRRDLLGDRPQVPDTVHPGRSQMEASTWRWFNESANKEDTSASNMSDSIVSGLGLNGMDQEPGRTPVSQDTISDQQFNYLAMREEPSDDEACQPNTARLDNYNERSHLELSIASSLGSLTNSLHTVAEKKVSFLTPVEGAHNNSSLVTVKRESLATLLNAFDQILLHGTL
ncbi:hypothetical protein M408DRAFT_206390 [Serendipita vermifera MAFF 305830]|uniref:Uncharacterized protein n=1 Tax=Serendipita vermifera MAFF 305830 TaxID=933852 RepID=A0A0C3B2G3_SERVB|nr:hypothetical protein M408DRAFT_206390 [Serendipita vermifera MAFF 305830]